MPTNESQPLIVGAGPVGLAAALFLARDGVKLRIIDLAPQRSPHSKALAVNPRTLELLEPTGITEKMLAIGKKIHGGQFWHDGKVMFGFNTGELPSKFNFMLALSQSVSQRLLEEALNAAGVEVERNTQLLRCRAYPDKVEADIQREGAPPETVFAPWMLAADGARSAARKSLGINFGGSTFETHWKLVDAPLQTDLAEDHAHIIALDGGGFLFVMRVVNDTPELQTNPPLWRVMGDVPDPLARFAFGKAAGPPAWKSDFKISHRIVDRMSQGKIYFAGDAAHIHSPMGARGMNLGIEDAWVFADLHRRGALEKYGAMRHKVDKKVVRRIDLMTRTMRGESAASRMFRTTIMPIIAGAPFARAPMLAAVSGLDHSVM